MSSVVEWYLPNMHAVMVVATLMKSMITRDGWEREARYFLLLWNVNCKDCKVARAFHDVWRIFLTWILNDSADWREDMFFVFVCIQVKISNFYFNLRKCRVENSSQQRHAVNLAIQLYKLQYFGKRCADRQLGECCRLILKNNCIETEHFILLPYKKTIYNKSDKSIKSRSLW